MAKKWIQKAIKKPGIFTAKAKKAGYSVGSYASMMKNKPGKMGKRARLAITLTKISRNGKSKSLHY